MSADMQKLNKTLVQSLQATLDRLVHELHRQAAVVQQRREVHDARKTQPARERALERLREAELPLAFLRGQIELMEAAHTANEGLFIELSAPPDDGWVPDDPQEAADKLWAWLQERGQTDYRTLYMAGEHAKVGKAEFILVFERAGYVGVIGLNEMQAFLEPYELSLRRIDDNTIGFYRT